MSFYSRPSSMDGFQLRIRSAYERLGSPDNHTGTFVMPSTIVWMVVSGEKEIEKEGVRYLLKEGDIVVFSPQDKITFGRSVEPFHFFTVAFHATVGAFHLPRLLSIPFRIRIPAEDRETLQRLTDKWRSLVRQMNIFVNSVNESGVPPAAGTDHLPSLLNTDQSIGYMRVHTQLMDLLAELLEHARSQLPAQPLTTDTRIQEICMYVHNHLSEPLHTSDLAKRAYVSEGHFRHLFREAFGVSPSDYIRRARIQRAQEMLHYSSLSIQSISEATGFPNYRSLIRVFKQVNGTSPAEYRKKVRQLEET